MKIQFESTNPICGLDKLTEQVISGHLAQVMAKMTKGFEQIAPSYSATWTAGIAELASMPIELTAKVPDVSPLTTEQQADVLEAAVALIETHGWLQGSYGSSVSGYCALGAILHAASGYISTLGRLLTNKIMEIDPTFWSDFQPDDYAPIHWNDAAGRTQDEVIELFRLVIKDLRNGA